MFFFHQVEHTFRFYENKVGSVSTKIILIGIPICKKWPLMPMNRNLRLKLIL